MTDLFSAVKTALRFTGDDSDLDDEIQSLILSAKMDLKIVGTVSDEWSTDKQDLIKQAVILYAKANWGFDNPDAPRFMDAYEKLKQALATHSQYDPKEV
ncbi:MAG: head-tail connector protein [Lactobacillaceae bacterium]|jgi:hypothetical protein|nr:head-tail connector protein [Lactobacillaceae bacterium]